MTLLRPSDHRYVTPGRLHALDGLRFAAAAAVVLYHFTGTRAEAWGTPTSTVFPALNEVTRYGFLGVEVFFVISGFAIMLTAADRSLASFVGSRAGRLLPAYWAAIAATAVLQLAWSGGRTPSTADTLVNLTMVQDVFGATSVQVVFWTLLVELKFYLLVGILVAVGITRGRLIAFAVLWPLAGQLAADNGAHVLTALLVPDYAPYFSLGIFLYLMYSQGHDVVVWLGAGLSLVLAVRLLTRDADHASALTGTHVSPVVCVAVVVALVAVVWLATSGPLARLRWPWLGTLGALTYPVYLVHSQFGYLVIDELHGSTNRWIVLLLAVGAGLAIAAAIRYGVEGPFGPRLRRGVEHGLTRAPGEPVFESRARARLSNS